MDRSSRAYFGWIALGDTLPTNEQPCQANAKDSENSDSDNTYNLDF